MKKYIDLQLFADEEVAAEVETPETAPEEKAQEEKSTPQAKYTDEDVDKLINRKFAEWQKQQDKKVSEAEKLGRMSEEEKTAERIRQLEEKLAKADRREARAAMTKQARAILQDANINVNDELLSNLIADDADTTKASVNSFITLFKGAVEKAVKEAYKGETPRKGAAPTLTKEQILKIENRAERQRLMAENAHLF